MTWAWRLFTDLMMSLGNHPTVVESERGLIGATRVAHNLNAIRGIHGTEYGACVSGTAKCLEEVNMINWSEVCVRDLLATEPV